MIELTLRVDFQVRSQLYVGRKMDLIKVKNAIMPILESLGYEMVDIEYEKKYGEMNLTVFIYKKGLDLNDCEKVHYAIDPVLDQLDPSFGKPYVLNVSSPGLDRPFKSQRDFERNYGEEVELKLYAPIKGKKVYEGVLISRGQNVTIISISNQEISFENNKIALVRPLVKFE